jgi:endonuclease/exonuclease/phosphatase family metal-dependent hydrolase
MIRTFQSLAAVLLLVAVVAADYVEVRRAATIREEPRGDATVLGRPDVGALLDLVGPDQTNGYYHVRLPGGAGDGWIYRTLVRRHAGQAPGSGPHPQPAAPDEIDVMWWNVRNLTSASRDDTEVRQIARCMGGMEVVAVGELEDPAVLDRIAARLGATYRHAATPKIGRTPSTAEHYGFVWDSGRVAIVGDPRNDADPGDRLDRDPGYATFRTTDGNLDFTVIAIHVTWGSTVAGRQAEIRELPGVWDRVQAATPDDDDLILVGDFNRNVGDIAFDDLLAKPGLVRANEDTGSTHISSTSTYDQVFLSRTYTTELTGAWRTLAFDETIFGNDDVAASLACSDHRPVSVTLRVPATGDDDGS